MKVRCPGCTSEFVVDDGRIPPHGTQVRCPKCFKAFQVQGQSSDPTSMLEAELGLTGTPAAPASASKTAGLGTGGFGPGMAPPDPKATGLMNKPTEIVGGQIPKAKPAGPAPSAVPFGAPPPAAGQVNRTEVVVPPMNVAPKGQQSAPAAPGAFEFELSEGLGLFGSSGQKQPLPESLSGPPSGSIFSAEELFRASDPGAAKAQIPSPPNPFGNPMQELSHPGFEIASDQEVQLDLSMAPPSIAPMPSVAPPIAPTGGFSDFGALPLGPPPSAPSYPPPPAGPGSAVGTYSGTGYQAPEAVLGPMPQPTGGSAGFGPLPPPPAQSATGFGAGPATKGAAGPSLDDIDFSMLLDESPEQPHSGGIPAGQPSASPFERPEMPEAFRMEEISFDDLGDLNAKNAAPAEPAFSYDLDVEAPTAPKAAPLGMAGTGLGKAAAGTQGKGAKKAAAKKKSSSAGGLLIALLVLVAGGAGAWYFGLLNPLLGIEEGASEGAGTKAAKKGASAPKALTFDSRLMTGSQEYLHRLDLLDKEMKVNPSTKDALEAEVMWNLAWFQLLFPGEFKNYKRDGKSLEEVLKEFKTKYITTKNPTVDAVFVDKMAAMEAGVANDWKKADEAYRAYVKGKSVRAGQLLESNQMTKALAREDNLFEALVGLRNNQLADAERLLAQLREERKEDVHSNYLLAQLEAAKADAMKPDQQDKAAAAREKAAGYLGEVLEGAPEFADARLLLADLMLKKGDPKRAVELAVECLEQAKKKSDAMAQLRGYRSVAFYLEKQNDQESLFKMLEDFYANLSNLSDAGLPEDLLLKLIGLYSDRKDLVKAQDVLKRCDKVCSSPAYYLLATRVFRAAGRVEAANQLAADGVRKHPQDHDLLVAMAEVALHSKRMDSARSYLEQALRKKPDDADSAKTLAKLYVDIKEWTDARRVLQTTLRAAPNALPLLELLAEVNEALGEEKEVAATYKHLLELKDDITVRQRLVRILARLGDHKEALKHFTILEGKGGMTKELRPSYALALRAADRIPEAVEVLKAVFKDNPADLEAARFLADIYVGKKDFFNAKFYLEACRRIDTGDANVHHELGKACLEIQDDACAVEAFRAAAELKPDNLTFLESYSKILYKLARKDNTDARKKLTEQARKYFDYIIAKYESDVTIPKDKQDAEIYFSRSTILFEAGYFDNALRDLEQAMNRAPNRQEILIRYADTLFQMGRYDDAEKYYLEMVDSKADLVYAYLQLGRIFLNRGDRERAKEWLTKCTTEVPGKYPEAFRFLGDIYLEKGLRKVAAVNYEHFLKYASPTDPALEEVRSQLRRLK